MFSYSGPAQLIYPDGQTTDMDCSLAEFQDMHGGLRSWSGSGSTSTPIDPGEARLRLPDGREATALIDVNVRADSAGVQVTLSIQGSGPPPGGRE